MKFASRPSRSPIGPTAQVTSPSDSAGIAAVVGEPYHRDDATEKAAVEGHAAFPHLEYLYRVFEKMRQVVEQHIAGPSAEDDAQRHPQDEIVVVEDGHGRRAAPVSFVGDDGAGIEPAEQDAADIGERIPADREGPDGHQHGIEGRERDEGGGHEGFPAARMT